MKTKFKSILLLSLLLLSTISSIGVISVTAEVCIADFEVSSDGTAVLSPVLEFGKLYRIVASEVFSAGFPYTVDAMYYTDGASTWDWTNHNPAPGGHSFLQIDGADVPWGPFSNGDTFHTYSINVIGTGSALMFQIIDWLDGDYSNNDCHIRVRICELPDEFYGGTPGFWKNHPDAWVGFTPDDSVCVNFPEAQPYGFCGDSLMEALRYRGGRGDVGAARILLRAATAAILNAEHPVINYPLTTAEILASVNSALASGDRDVMINLATLLDDNNNAGLPWDD
jgi:hypothetical protein